LTNNRRKGKGIFWTMVEKTGFGTRETTGYTIDDLDTKPIESAKSPYEETFISVRTVLESKLDADMSNESERLQCTQDIADLLHRKA